MLGNLQRSLEVIFWEFQGLGYVAQGFLVTSELFNNLHLGLKASQEMPNTLKINPNPH